MDRKMGNSIILWHGTTQSRAKSILREGFRIEKAMRWEGRGRKIYFALKPALARRYARSKARVEHDRPVVFTCSIDLNHYSNYEREGAEIYAFGHECIDAEVITEVHGLPKRQLEKLQKREDDAVERGDVELTNVALTFNSACAGIAYWMNNYLKLEGDQRIEEDHDAVGEIKAWLDAQAMAGRFGEVPHEEMLMQLRKYLPQHSP